MVALELLVYTSLLVCLYMLAGSCLEWASLCWIIDKVRGMEIPIESRLLFANHIRIGA